MVYANVSNVILIEVSHLRVPTNITLPDLNQKIQEFVV
jgi:hypothetical protein